MHITTHKTIRYLTHFAVLLFSGISAPNRPAAKNAEMIVEKYSFTTPAHTPAATPVRINAPSATMNISDEKAHTAIKRF